MYRFKYVGGDNATWKWIKSQRKIMIDKITYNYMFQLMELEGYHNGTLKQAEHGA